MSMDIKNGKIAALAATLALSASAYADDGGNAMQAHTEAGKDAATTARADAAAKGFAADMAKMTSEMNMGTKAAASASSSARGVHGRVLGLDRMKMLMVKKNEDGTFTVDHVSANEESVKAFVAAESKSQVAEEE